MPIEIYDKNNKYLGIIQKKYYNNLNIYMVAITELQFKDIDFDIVKIKKFLASVYDCVTILGKIKEDKFEEKLKEIREEEKNNKFIEVKHDDFLKVLFLQHFHGEGFEDVININISKENIKGYLLIDIGKIQVQHGRFIIEDDIDYITEKKIGDSIPIYAKIVNYPVVKTDIMGMSGIFQGANLADFGGRNHSHITSLEIKSGNFKDSLEIPMLLTVKKDMNIQFDIAKRQIKQVFCDGIIYKFNKY